MCHNMESMSYSAQLRKTFSERLFEARTKVDISQSELARRIKVHPSMVCRFESGRRLPSADYLVTLAEELSVTTDFLLGRSLTIR
jgi:transcriptional regulator with XRE-family HTH domain